ncbi:hypothetical protein M0813_01285 [Anaeramoeba flamelloides]|uniref:ubiquitinyl hydrolase 1 n=1 Tax=Anaeramoeba flamelloides TaxID=1746091 RepID=A0ABQ8Z8T3_9EUKA|nr:hypothetical protein M0813_01285 [Anaeramoeba flamelloides]
MAKPFIGKYTPKERSEFGNSDIIIGLTILSYYYHGITEREIKQILIYLHKKYDNDLNKANKIYQSFFNLIKDTKGIPDSIKQFSTIEYDNEKCLKILKRYYSKNRIMIHYYLNKFIFPHEAKEFQVKETATAHDTANSKFFTGFSGTKGNQKTMSSDIKEIVVIKDQQGTDGRNLYLPVMEENNTYISIKYENDYEVLEKVCQFIVGNLENFPNYQKKKRLKHHLNCKAFIDRGALINSLLNLQVANFILSRTNNIFKGVIFFEEETGEIKVLTNQNSIIPYASCKIKKKYLFAYLDHIHTRGTDLQLDLKTHGIVTISAGITMDQLSQAIWRLRELGNGQTFSIWAHEKITKLIWDQEYNYIDDQYSEKHSTKNLNEIDNRNVIRWVCANSINESDRNLLISIKQEFQFKIKQMSFNYITDNNHYLPLLVDTLQDFTPTNLEQLYKFSHIKTYTNHYLMNYSCKLIQNITQYCNNCLNMNKKGRLIKKIEDQIMDQFQVITGAKIQYCPKKVIAASLDNIEHHVEKEVELEQEEVVEREFPANNEHSKQRTWDFSVIYEENFIKNCFSTDFILKPNNNNNNNNENDNSKKNNYPKLYKLNESFTEKDQTLLIELKDINKIKWNNHILVSCNFLHTICYSKESIQPIDEYLRPVSCYLTISANNEEYYILFSDWEITQIRLQLGNNKNRNINFNIKFLKDLVGTTFWPFNGKKNLQISAQEKKVITQLKFFNGETYYEPNELQYLKQFLGILDKRAFITSQENNLQIKINEDRSTQIWGFLKDNNIINYRGELKNGDVLEKMKLSNFPKLDIKEFSIVEKILKELITIKSFNGSSIYIEKFVELLISHRGKLNQYKGSKLENIFKI